MLVVDLIERRLGNDVAPIGILDDARASRREQDCDAFDDGMQVGDVRQRVGGDDRVSLAVRRDDLARHLSIKEPADGGHTAGDGGLRDAGRWLDPEMANACVRRMTQQGAVITAKLDDEGITRRQRRDEVTGQAGKVFLHPDRGGREERIPFVEHALTLRLFHQLHQGATTTIGGAQVEKVLVRELIGRQKPVGKRHPAEVDERLDVRVADAAT